MSKMSFWKIARLGFLWSKASEPPPENSELKAFLVKGGFSADKEQFWNLVKQNLSPGDQAQLLAFLKEVPNCKIGSLIRFCISGDDSQGEVLDYLDESEAAQDVVDIAFSLHVSSLHELGRSLGLGE